MTAQFNANSPLELTLKRLTPQFIKTQLKPFYYKLKNFSFNQQLNQAKSAFEKAPEAPIWLDKKEIAILQSKYPWRQSYQGYILDHEKRGEQKAQEIINLIPATEKTEINNFLELGCGHGLVSYFLKRMGKNTTAIDVSSARFSEKAIQEEVKLFQMDVACLQFEDETFDFIFSFDAFEHFPDPESALQEAIRVLKIGGYIYLNFDPLYMAPWGLHAWTFISFPYCQILFRIEDLQDFVKDKISQPIAQHMNGWTLEQYRELWGRYSDRLEKVKYLERYDTEHIKLIKQYPSVFKSKTKYFDNFIVTGIEVIFKKIK